MGIFFNNRRTAGSGAGKVVEVKPVKKSGNELDEVTGPVNKEGYDQNAPKNNPNSKISQETYDKAKGTFF